MIINKIEIVNNKNLNLEQINNKILMKKKISNMRKL